MTKMTRVWAMPSAETFSIRPIARLLDRYLQPGAVILDPFARNSLRATHTNDLNPATEALWQPCHADVLLEWANAPEVTE